MEKGIGPSRIEAKEGLHMASFVEHLTRLIDAPDRFDIPYDQLVGHQIAAANERFGQRIGEISLLGHRAETAGLGRVTGLADLVPLLFAHTTYKSYPESWLVQKKWDRMASWLETVSTYPVARVADNAIGDIDDWLAALEGEGSFVSCSSGTTGKCSMLVASASDRSFAKRNTALAFAWSTAIDPQRDFKIMAVVPVPSSPRNKDVRAAISERFGNGDDYHFHGGNMTIGQVSKMVALRRTIADGTAPPEDLAAYERTTAQRQAELDIGIDEAVQALIDNRARKLLVSGQFVMLHQMAHKIRAAGYGRHDFQPDNAMFVGGGLKGAVLPPDYREFIMETFNLSYGRVYQYYGMQELNTTMPRCAKGRYHVPPWLIPLMLDDTGDNLLTPSGGEIEGRAGFFDLSLDARWGGIISGDRIQMRFGRCDCGHQGPTVGPDIVRYADVGDGDKITCAGTIDAYVRGVA